MSGYKNKFFKAIAPCVEKQYGRERAGELLGAAWARFEAIAAENANESPAKKAHTHGRIYPAIAIFLTIAEADGRERARSLIYDFYVEKSKKAGEVYRGLLKLPGLYKCVPMIFMDTIGRMFGEDAGFAYRFYDEGRGVCRFDTLKCPYTDACAKYGCPEVTAAFCDSDDGCYGGLHPRLEWRRTKTLGKGGDCCDFCIRIVKS